MVTKKEIKLSFFIALWFIVLTFPIMVIKVNTITHIVDFRWANIFWVGITSFFASLIWNYFLRMKEEKKKTETNDDVPFVHRMLQNQKIKTPFLAALAVFFLVYPFVFPMYHTSIMISALVYVMLGLGLNIVVGLAGLLDLGYVAFYAVGAYAYALLNLHFGISFWVVLPISAALGAICGTLLGYPVLRLRGDYLAIVTLGFGEIIRIILENWDDFSNGPRGIGNIPAPSFFGHQFEQHASVIYIYFIVIGLVLMTIFFVGRLENSRIGRAWIALRDDDIACQAMGIDKFKTKLTAFALGATWASIAGVVFAAKTSFINPMSFTIWESITILCVVVIGGMGSAIGVIAGALVLILLPEYLRAVAEYRMLVFGALQVIVMVFKPEGLIQSVRKIYKFEKVEE
ncbi:MAG: high-affinity branched-chain amino acid ABC transporter permease LivM [Proteobacteria bacterium]|nr:high-affinity branched-chain amino acid ABC transporter permease LivM [Pseudomonadota bacterium]MBU1584941.1 high-affinity branched-chain amino acid ABC transporter permease LivM [Pseudomonadota bacterium]MBU2627745.1 high-affinity branched-chain amino acid ABC transporter permease LivM [Pseudomonadota bacterium]